jgi:phosphatidylglycerophosphatase C
MGDLGLEPEVLATVEQVAALGASAAAAFDADGTVWSGDIGEDLLRELALHQRLIDPPPGDPYAVYEGLFAKDPPRAFAYCMEVMRGLEVSDVERLSDELIRTRFAARVFPSVRSALDLLREAGVAIYLVSASNAVTIRRAAIHLSLRPELALAVEGAVDERGQLTGQVLPPVTCGAGKVAALRPRLGGRKLALAFGNSLFDREMLELAEKAVIVAPRGVETPAVALASQRGWPVHRVG